ncbi:hypothetical protein BS47DRAFT_1350537 [Hydnum rufescens UP504]|uniref:Uncharacterized protein n=1 Tax=Hydnum rufescens UP504 TaxID=1448309 RepID=A0A9P6AM52_9AGAM|nr:hypothetical protein BS47DRAFT_1350537 [Hydnum rufescens UP504]
MDTTIFLNRGPSHIRQVRRIQIGGVHEEVWGEVILNHDHNRPACESKACMIHPRPRSGPFDEGAPMNQLFSLKCGKLQ